jgi:hypothetical protein
MWRISEYSEKATDLSQDTDKLDHIMFFSGTPRHELVRTHNLSSDCTGSCKFNYYAITTTTAPFIMVITKLPNTEQSSKGKGKTHKSTNRQNQSTTGKLGNPQWP